MKRRKTLLILGAVLIATIAGIAGVKAIEKHVDKVNTIDEVVFTLDTDKASGVTLDYEGKDLSLTKQDDVWKDASDMDFPIDQDYMVDFLKKFESVHASFIIEDVEDYGQYGLKDPTATITFTEDDKEKTITFGTFSTIDSKRYICVDGKDVYLIDNDLLEDMSADRDAFMANKEIPDFSQITEIEASGKASFTVEYDPDGSYTYTDAYDYYLVEGDAHKPVDTELVEKYYSNIKNIDTSKYETYKAGEADLKKYGLDNPDLTITARGDVDPDDSDQTKETEFTIYFSSPDDENAYAYVDKSSIIYAVDTNTYEELLKGGYSSLRPTEIIDVSFTDVSDVICKVEDMAFTVTASNDSSADGGVEYKVDGNEINFATAADKIKNLSLSEAGDDYELGVKELEYTVNLKDEANTSLNVILYRYDGDSCVATLNGETLGLVSRTSMSNLREGIISAKLNVGKEEKN